MTEIIDGKLILNEVSRNSKGGTELMAMRMIEHIPQDVLDGVQIIHSRVREILPNKKHILVLHDLPNDPESSRLSDPEFRKQFDAIVCVSNWQNQYYQMVHQIRPSELTVIKNAIDPIVLEPDQKVFDDQVSLIYHTTPHRGLEILVPVFEHMQKFFGDSIHLDVFSSFSVYGWGERDEVYEPLFDRMRTNAGITYHGGKPNSDVRAALANAHIFAYPCVWPETSCLAAIEALSAKCVVVCPNYAALPETCADWAMMYDFHGNYDAHANRFAQVLGGTIELVKKGSLEEILNAQKSYYDHFYNMKSRASQWINLITSIKA